MLFQYVYENSSHEEALLTREKFMEVNARMESRREYLQRECSRSGLDSPGHKPYAWEYLINRQYHVIWLVQSTISYSLIHFLLIIK